MNTHMHGYVHIEGCKDALGASDCRSLHARQPLIIGLFCKTRPVEIRHPICAHPCLCAREGWQGCIRCLRSQVSNRKRVTYYGALLRKMTSCITQPAHIHGYVYLQDEDQWWEKSGLDHAHALLGPESCRTCENCMSLVRISPVTREMYAFVHEWYT